MSRSEELSKRNCCSVMDLRDLAKQHEKEFSKFASERDEKRAIRSPPMVAARSGRHFLLSFMTDCAALEKIVLMTMATRN